MAKTLISRLDAENIVRAAVDPETHEATGDVYDSVNDISYPFGGEGGENNICTLTIDNQIQPTRAYTELNLFDIVSDTILNWIDDNNILLDTDTIGDTTIPYGVSTFRCIPANLKTGDEITVVIAGIAEYLETTVSDLANCNIDEHKIVTPIDATKPSSFKITVTGEA